MSGSNSLYYKDATYRDAVTRGHDAQATIITYEQKKDVLIDNIKPVLVVFEFVIENTKYTNQYYTAEYAPSGLRWGFG